MSRPEHDDPERYAHLAGFDTEWRDTWWNEDYLGLLARRFRLGDRRHVLDVGCGVGHWGSRLLPHLHPQARLCGLDREQDFFSHARARAEARGYADRLELAVGEADALPFGDATFDMVTCQTVLIHVPDVPAVLAEMVRVTRPGGLVLVAEPDNLAGNLAHLTTSGLPDETVARLVRFQQICQRGKIALGEGDDSIGARLPGLCAKAGLRDVQAFTNDRCMALWPPYERPDMRIELEQELAWAAEDISTLGSPNGTRRLFVAGGGDEADYDAHWADVLAFVRGFESAIAEQRYHGGRGYLMYVVGGDRP